MKIARSVLVNDMGKGQKPFVALIFSIMDPEGRCVGQHHVDSAPKEEAPGHAPPHGTHLTLGVLHCRRMVVEHRTFKADDRQAFEGYHLAMNIFTTVRWVVGIAVIVVAADIIEGRIKNGHEV